MTTKFYGEIGSNAQQIGGDKPSGYVEMSGMRPDGYYICEDNGDGTGTWVAATEPKRYSSREFTAFFTTAELNAIYTHAETVLDTRIWIDQVMGADFIDTTDQLTVNGMAYAVYQGLITQARHDEILGL